MAATEILSLVSFPQALEDELDKTYRVFRKKDLESGADLSGVRALLTNIGAGARNEMLDKMPKLEIISMFAVGYDCVDMDYAKRRGLRVANTPDIVTNDTADLALGLMIAVNRKMLVNDRFVRAGGWLKGPPIAGRSLTGLRVGIVGLGAIGSAIAKRCEPMVASIAYHNRNPRDGAPYRYYASLTDLARNCDVMIVSADGRARGLVSAEVIEALGPTGVLINVSRGPVVDEPALVAALVEGRLGGAGLDVFAQEPKVPEALFALDNVVLLPHIGTGTVETRFAMARMAMDNIALHFAGKPLLGAVL
jgi:lactate dehydrogenase-like 2-hydroxyacid dehydrogenase